MKSRAAASFRIPPNSSMRASTLDEAKMLVHWPGSAISNFWLKSGSQWCQRSMELQTSRVKPNVRVFHPSGNNTSPLCETVRIISITKAQIPIPNGLHPNTISVLINGAEAVTVDLLGVLDDPLIVHERVGIDVRGIVVRAGCGQPIGRVESLFEAIQITAQPIELPRCNRGWGWFMYFKRLGRKSSTARSGEIQIARTIFIFFENVTAADIRDRGVIRVSLGISTR